MTDPAELPPLPEPAYQWIDDYYDGWWCMNAVPDDRYSTLDTFTAAQMLEYGAACALAEREACARLCDGYSKYLIALDADSVANEYEAHGAESCSNLLRGMNEYGDPPDSPHFGDSYAATMQAREVGAVDVQAERQVPELTERQIAFHRGVSESGKFTAAATAIRARGEVK